MRENRKIIQIVLIIVICSLFASICFEFKIDNYFSLFINNHREYLTNIFSGIFISAILTMGISTIGYFTSRLFLQNKIWAEIGKQIQSVNYFIGYFSKKKECDFDKEYVTNRIKELQEKYVDIVIMKSELKYFKKTSKIAKLLDDLILGLGDINCIITDIYLYLNKLTEEPIDIKLYVDKLFSLNTNLNEKNEMFRELIGVKSQNKYKEMLKKYYFQIE